VHDRPLPYHLVLRTRTYKAWRPLLGLGLFIVSFVVLTVVVTVCGVLLDMAATGDSYDVVADRLFTDVTPLALLTANLSLAALIPAAALAIVAANRLGPGWLCSVLGRMRWRLLWRFLWLALAVVVGATLVAGFLTPVEETDASMEVVSLGRWLSLAVVILLTTPLQAAGEEVGFRGYQMQALGAWFRTPWVGIVATSLVFAFAHGSQNPALFVDRLGFGLVAAWLVVRTGGLEASIALHTVNNVITFLIAAAFDGVDDALTVTEAPWSLAVLDIAQALVFAVFVVRLVKRREVAVVTAAPSLTA